MILCIWFVDDRVYGNRFLFIVSTIRICDTRNIKFYGMPPWSIIVECLYVRPLSFWKMENFPTLPINTIYIYGQKNATLLEMFLFFYAFVLPSLADAPYMQPHPLLDLPSI